MGLQRSTTKRIPDSWDLGGDIEKDPIADSLYVRIKENAIVGSLIQAPDYHKFKKFPRHKIPAELN